MRIRNTFVQIALMVVAAAAIAVIANGFAGRTRRLVLPGYYPDARVVPARVARASGAPLVPPPQGAPEARATPVTTDTTPTTGTTTTTAEPVVTTTTQAPVPSGGLKPAAPQVVEKPPAPAPDVAKFTPHPDKAYVEIGYDDVAALHGAGALFLDARRTSVYEEGHIAGARSISVWEADKGDKVNALFGERSDPREQNLPIVIYCSGGACEDSHMLAQDLWGIQFNNVYVYKDGFPDWQKRGGAVKTGSNP
ncbi:MAG TPA: rhodanese-like domain-containing protein [Thermoanaerobaculia bacterium]|nr:rhodanese-like domain-containing protein [Thermoanaerobaculia bacterium]